jgi:hypothetical protein
VKRSLAAKAEQRGSSRSPVDVPLEFTTHDSWDTVPGVAKDLSLGGMFIETRHPAPFGESVLVRVRPPGGERAVLLPAIVRWTRHDGMGVQFGALGARETHAVMEIARRSMNRRTPPDREVVSEDELGDPTSEVRPLVPLFAIPWLAVTVEGLHVLPLDARSAYLLSLTDGECSVEMILDICAHELERESALAVFARLLQLGAIELRDP